MPINPFDSADKVNAVIKIRRGPESDRINSIYDSGELIYTTDKKRVYVGDGIDASGTYGGNIIGNKAWITDNFAKLNNIEIGDTVYRTDTSAYYVLTASAYILESSYALVGGNELINRNTLDVTVPKATKSTLGIIKVGVDLDIAGDGTLNLPKATASVLGGVKAGTGLSVAGDGTLSVTGGDAYILPKATNSTLGGVKVGIGLSADNTGKLSLSAIPQTASTGQVLTWNGTKWIASDPTGGTNGDSVPIGSVIYFAASANIPTDYLPCDGRAVNRSYYADLDSVIYCGDANNSNVKTIFGYRCTLATSPNTTRNTLGQYIVIPDLRGEFIRGWDNGRGIDTGRKFGSYQADDFRSHFHILPVNNNNHGGATSGNAYQDGGEGTDNYTGASLTDSTGGPETRPRNIALVACIKVLKTGAPSVINYIPKPATATNGQVLTYQNSTNSWVASASSYEKVHYTPNDHFVISIRPNESNTTGAINLNYADNTWRNIKTITKLPWASYFGTRNPKNITVAVYAGEAEVMATIGNPINFSDNTMATINGKTYLGDTLNYTGDNSGKYSTNKIWLDDDNTFYLKIRKTNPETYTCRIYLIEAEF